MAGYLNRFIDLPFPDLAGVDDAGRALCWVKIRNPRLIPGEDLMGMNAGVRLDADGKPLPGEDVTASAFAAFARLIIAGQVWDAQSVEEEAPLLGMPPTPGEVGRMPMEILNAIGVELSKANPR